MKINTWERSVMQKRYAEKITSAFMLLFLLLAGSALANVRGTIDTVSGWYPAGETLTVTASPADYRYVEWSGDTNGAQFAENTISFTVDGARQVDVAFKDHVTDYMSIPWWWLAAQNAAWTNDFEAAASGTHNGSSLTAGQAYWTGTDPQSSSTLFEISKVERVSSGQLQLTWAHANVASGLPAVIIEGRVSMINGSWEPVGENIPVNGTIVWEVPAVVADNYRFFRLRVNTP
jgi:hypothetical protein